MTRRGRSTRRLTPPLRRFAAAVAVTHAGALAGKPGRVASGAAWKFISGPVLTGQASFPSRQPISHSLTVLSVPQLASNCPSGLNATPLTGPRWPVRAGAGAGCAGSVTSHKMTA